MHTLRTLSIVLAAGWLAACSPQPGAPGASAGNAFPMGVADRFDQPVPTKPLFADPIVVASSVLPPSKPDVREPLPPLAALPKATHTEAAPAATGNPEKDGAVNPAAGQAAAISDGQGEGNKQELGAPTK